MLTLPSEEIQNTFTEMIYTVIVKGRSVHFCLQKSVEKIPDFENITSASVIPFVSKTEIIVTQLARGVDIPGGHTEPIDKDIVATVERESAEEACIQLTQPLYVIGVISSDYKGPDPEDVTYMIITTSKVSSLNNFVAKFESSGRVEMTIEDFLRKYKAGSHEVMAELLSRARMICDEFFEG